MQKKALLTGIVLTGIFYSQTLFAQFKSVYFFDTIPARSNIRTAVQDGAFIYTAGTARDSFGEQPSILKFDTLGNLQWASYYFGLSADDYTPTGLAAIDGDIYVTSWGTPGNPNTLGSAQLSRIIPETGQTLYNQPLGAKIWDGHLLPYDNTRLLAYFTDDYDGSSIYNQKIGRIDRNSGQLLDAMPLFKTDWQQRPGGFTAGAGSGIFYSNRDTVFRRDYQDFSQKLWAVKLTPGSVQADYFTHLVLNEPEQALFAFGTTKLQENLCAARLNAQTGAVVWSYRSTLASGYDPGRVLFDGDFVYVSWQHKYVGGGVYQLILTKLNRHTGEKLWEVLHEQVPGNFEEQSNLGMTYADGHLYLTGYYEGDNYGPGKWGVLAVKAADGSVVYRKQVPPVELSVPQETRSSGRAVFAFGNRLAVLGNTEKENRESFGTWVEMDRATGAITRRTLFPGNYRHPSATTHLIQLAGGSIIALKQQGRSCVVEQLDGNGNVGWFRELKQEFGLKAIQLAQVRGDSFIVAGFSYVDEPGFYSNSQASKTLWLYLFDSKGVLLKTLSRAWPENYRNVGSIIRDPQAEQYFLTIRDAGGTRVGRFNFTGWHGETQALGNGQAQLNGNQSLYKPKNTNFLYLFTNGIYWMDLNAWPATTAHPQGGIFGYNHLEALDSTALGCGMSQSAKPFLALYRGPQLYNIKTVTDFPDLQQFSGLVQGEGDSVVYLLGEGPYAVRVFKFDLKSWTVLWSVPVFEGPQADAFRLTDFVFNPVSKLLSVCGAWGDPNTGLDWQIFTKSFDGGTGQQLLEFFANHTDYYTDEALAALADRQSVSTLVGGHINQDGWGNATGFIHFFDNDFSNAVNARVFWDVNENGQYEAGADQPLALGSLLLDQAVSLYFNATGVVSVLTAPGAHQLDFQIPAGWALTSGSTSSSVNTLFPPTDTFFIGLKPIDLSTGVAAYLVGAHLVCDDTARVFLFVKNSGPAAAPVTLRLQHPGGFLAADIPPATQAADTVYWDIPALQPGGQWLNTLRFKMPGVAAIGDSLTFVLQSIFPKNGAPAGQKDTAQFVYRDLLLCAYDPNDKLVAPPGTGPAGLTPFGTELNYTVRFQNTGNFPARTVVIRDTLATDLDAASFAFVASSHPATAIVRDGNALEFVFREIYLPDSTADLAGSQGFVSFRVQPKSGLPEMTAVRNRAFIYFDANPPVETNTTLTTFVGDPLVGATAVDLNAWEVMVYPNPTSGTIQVEMHQPTSPETTFRIVDVAGRPVLEERPESGVQWLKIQAGILPAGLYFLQVCESGHVRATAKFIKR